LPADRILLTFMGLDLSELASLGKERSYIPGKLHLVTVARLNPAKGHVHALAAIRTNAGLDLHYTIAGEGPHLEAIRSQIKALELGEHVTLTGTVKTRRRIGEAARKTAERRFDITLTATALRDAILARAQPVNPRPTSVSFGRKIGGDTPLGR
jgi:hypothetical protein